MSSLVVSKVPDPSDISHSILLMSSGGWRYHPHFAGGYPGGTAKLKVTRLAKWQNLESSSRCPNFSSSCHSPGPRSGWLAPLSHSMKSVVLLGECLVRLHAWMTTPHRATQPSPSVKMDFLGGYFFLRRETAGKSLPCCFLYFLYSFLCSIFNFLF